MSTRQQAEDQIINRAIRDPEFRATLLADPHTALEDELGIAPEGITVTFVEETPQQIYIVLPADPSSSAALSDDELSVVAGGSGGSHRSHASNPLDPRC